MGHRECLGLSSTVTNWNNSLGADPVERAYNQINSNPLDSNLSRIIERSLREHSRHFMQIHWSASRLTPFSRHSTPKGQEII